MNPRPRMALLAAAVAALAVVPTAAQVASASSNARDDLVVLAGSHHDLVYAEHPVDSDGDPILTEGDLHLLTAGGKDTDLATTVGSESTSDATSSTSHYSLVGSTLTATRMSDPTQVEWWDLDASTSGIVAVPSGATWQGSAPGGWIVLQADGSVATESFDGSLTADPLPAGLTASPGSAVTSVVSGPDGFAAIAGVPATGPTATPAALAAIYQPWDPTTAAASLDLPTATTDGTADLSCGSLSGSILACQETDAAGDSTVLAVPVDGSAARSYPGCAGSPVAVGDRLAFACGHDPAHPRFASGTTEVARSHVEVHHAAGVSAFGSFVTTSQSRHSVLEIHGASSGSVTLVSSPGALASGDDANLRAAASALQAQAVAAGALPAVMWSGPPALLIQQATSSLLRTARAADPSLVPTDTRDLMGPVPHPIAHHPSHPHHKHVTATHTLDLFDAAVPDHGSPGLGMHHTHGGSYPAPFQPSDGVYVDPTMSTLDAPTIAEVAIRAALHKLGQPYVWAGGGPKTFDCSGLVQWAYAHAGIHLHHFTGDQWNEGRLLHARDILPGDLILFEHVVGHHEVIHHVGIYLGADWMINAPYTGQYVEVERVPDGVAGVVRP